MDQAPKHADYKSLGCPDVSFHGQSAWRPNLEYFRKQLGIMYWGAYAQKADGTADQNFYVAYNLHWGTHKLGLPRLPKGLIWQPLYDTSGGGAVVKDRIYEQMEKNLSEKSGYGNLDLKLHMQIAHPQV